VSRRTLTLLLASVLSVLLSAGAVQARVPYVALDPGPTYDTLGEVDGEPLLQIEGRPTFPTDGRLDLTTIEVDSRLTLFEALEGWLDRDRAVVPREVVYPPGQTDQEVKRETAEQMAASQNSAVSAAARQLGFRTADVVVEGVAAGAPADGRLREGDVLRTVQGRPLRDAADLRNAVASGEIGGSVRIGYERAGRSAAVELRTAASDDDGERRPVIGVVTREEPVDAPFDVEITLEDVGGPSAGLMFALGILDKLSEPSLTGGAHIAGTGAITAQGEVGPIGGIAQKLVAAKAKGVDAFLVPEGNCADAVLTAPEGLPLVEVGTLAQALTALEALREDEQPELCPPG
jgi:PDZ domain-containing protein